MSQTRNSVHRPHSVSRLVRERIRQGGERLWRLDHFRGLPLSAVAQALSRLSRAGEIERLSKGIYYRPRATEFGESRPSPSAIQALVTRETPVFPAGVAAANLLGFTTQNPQNREIATTAASLPRKLVGEETVVHTRRPAAWQGLSEVDAALLDFLRRGGKTGELSPTETIARALDLLSQEDRFRRLADIAASEPPRVRALLGAMGQQLGVDPRRLQRLRDSLNPLSRYDFGMLSGLQHAREWQARER